MKMIIVKMKLEVDDNGHNDDDEVDDSGHN